MLRKIQLYRDAIAACFAANDTPLTMRQVLAWIDDKYPNNNYAKSVLSSQVYKSCSNVEYAQRSAAPKILFFNRENRTYQKNNASAPPLTADTTRPHFLKTLRSVPRLSLEDHLKTLLMQDLNKVEEGLSLWFTTPPSVEYTLANGGRVDILGKDRDGVPVVIELKRNEAHDKVIGQALLYQELVKAELMVERVRIFLVASVMTDAIRTASLSLSDVNLFEYSVSVQTHPIRKFEVNDVSSGG